MFDDEHDGPPLHVPPEALYKPKGAEVGDDGKVACVSCGQRFALSAVDIVGQGYRCAPCSHQAHVAGLELGRENVDAGAHLSRGERERLREQGVAMLWGGAGLVVIGAVLLIATFDTIGMKLGGFLIALGGGLAIMGSMKKTAGGG
jgi:hypothetical protein